jgi:hypothetical protein
MLRLPDILVRALLPHQSETVIKLRSRSFASMAYVARSMSAALATICVIIVLQALPQASAARSTNKTSAMNFNIAGGWTNVTDYQNPQVQQILNFTLDAIALRTVSWVEVAVNLKSGSAIFEFDYPVGRCCAQTSRFAVSGEKVFLTLDSFQLKVVRLHAMSVDLRLVFNRDSSTNIRRLSL